MVKANPEVKPDVHNKNRKNVPTLKTGCDTNSKPRLFFFRTTPCLLY